jgi:hypothetical protein
MAAWLLWLGRIGGGLGLALTAAALVLRLAGRYIAGGFQVGTLLLVGVAAMVAGCLGYLAYLAERRRD